MHHDIAHYRDAHTFIPEDMTVLRRTRWTTPKGRAPTIATTTSLNVYIWTTPTTSHLSLTFFPRVVEMHRYAFAGKKHTASRGSHVMSHYYRPCQRRKWQRYTSVLASPYAGPLSCGWVAVAISCPYQGAERAPDPDPRTFLPRGDMMGLDVYPNDA